MFIQNVQQGIMTKSGDALRITVLSSVNTTVTIVTRSITDQGRETIGNFSLTTNGLRTNQNLDIPLDTGMLLSVLVYSGSVLRGQVFVHGLIRRGDMNSGQYFMNIISNYVYSTCPICFPESPLISSYDGQGYLGRATGSGQSAIAINVNTNSRWRILLATVVLTSDANAGNRVVLLQLWNNGSTIASVVSPINQTASLSNIYLFGDYAPGTALQSDGSIRLKLPLNVFVDQVSSGQVAANNLGFIGAGDNMTFSVFYEEWLNA